MRILIVEDDTYSALYLEETLQEMGHEVVASLDSGSDAIAAAEELRPELVLMDIRIRGEMDGVDAAIKLREDFDIPSMFVTGLADQKIRDRAQRAQPIGYVEKPLDDYILRQLMDRAKAYLGLRR